MTTLEPMLRPWTVEEYHRAADAGVFHPDERLELIDGRIYQVSPQRGPHATACQLTEDLLREMFRTGYVIRGQKPLRVGGSSEPEPDVCVVRGRARDFARQHPTGAVLVVEVAESSAAMDLGPKAEQYARAGIEDYWVLLLPERALVVHRDPDASAGAYRTTQRLGENDAVAPVAASGAPIQVSDLLP